MATEQEVFIVNDTALDEDFVEIGFAKKILTFIIYL